jgi:hypothetical protein
MVQILQAYKERQERHIAAMGVEYVNNDLVFPNPDEMPWPPSTGLRDRCFRRRDKKTR